VRGEREREREEGVKLAEELGEREKPPGAQIVNLWAFWGVRKFPKKKIKGNFFAS
jgi:hypothetical protein